MTDDHLATCVVRARQICGCMHCRGGYEIGARTLAKPGATTFDGVTQPAAPSSCLAAVILGMLEKF